MPCSAKVKIESEARRLYARHLYANQISRRKDRAVPVVEGIIDANGFSGCTYVEPFAGGGGLAVKLLLKGRVSKIVLNDLDRAVYCMWKAIIHHPGELVSMINDAKLTIDEWKGHREVYRAKASCGDLEVGLASFYLNRTNVSGILKGGVIGGLGQDGPFKMDARFARDALVGKVRAISERAGDISLYNLDAVEFLDERLPAIPNPFVYLDPPYVKKGPGLYKDSFDESDHERLSKKIAECEAPWVMTYDRNDLVRRLYGHLILGSISMPYSAKTHRVGVEQLILSPLASFR